MKLLLFLLVSYTGFNVMFPAVIVYNQAPTDQQYCQMWREGSVTIVGATASELRAYCKSIKA